MEAVAVVLFVFSSFFYIAILPGAILSIVAYILSGVLGAKRRKAQYAKLTGVRKGIVPMLVFICISLVFSATALAGLAENSYLYRHDSSYASFVSVNNTVLASDCVVLVMCIAALIVSSVVRNKCVAADPAIAQPDRPQPVQPAVPANVVYVPVQQAAPVQQAVPVQQAAPAAANFCTSCGAPLEAGAKFCSACGAKQGN